MFIRVKVVAAKVSLKKEVAITILSVYTPPGSNQNDTIKDQKLILSEVGSEKNSHYWRH